MTKTFVALHLTFVFVIALFSTHAFAAEQKCRIYKLMEKTYVGEVYDLSKMWICHDPKKPEVIKSVSLKDWGSIGQNYESIKIGIDRKRNVIGIDYGNACKIYLKPVPGKDEFQYGFCYQIFERRVIPMLSSEFDAEQKQLKSWADARPQAPVAEATYNDWKVSDSGTIRLYWENGKIKSADLLNWGGVDHLRQRTRVAKDGFISIMIDRSTSSIIYLKAIDPTHLSYQFNQRSFSLHDRKAILIK